MTYQDDLLEAYEEFWPGGQHNKKWFAAVTKDIVDEFLIEDTPLPLREINRELEKLGKIIRDLSPEVRHIIHDREIGIWHDDHADVKLFDNAFAEQVFSVVNGGSSLDILAKATGDKYQRQKQKNANKRRIFLTKAATIFKLAGGRIESRINSDFVIYVEQIFEDVGFPDADIPKIVRVFMSE